MPWKDKEQDKEYKRGWWRKHMLSTGGKKIKVLKRDYPEDECCELCRKRCRSRLQYHHWDGTNLSLGMWICISCHQFAHGVESDYLTKYIELKEEIEKKNAK